MTFDPAKIVGAVTREITSRDHEGKPARVLVAGRTYDTDIEDLWDALTNAQPLPRWFLPVSGDLKLGGRYHLKGNASGAITACEPPRHLAITWEWQEDVSWVEVQLTEEGSGATHLRLEHLAHVPDEFWEQYGPGAVGIGWDLALLGLEQHFEANPSVTPKDADTLHTTEAGKTFIHLASDAWRQASIAAGTEPSTAKSSAERTRAFYTGEEAQLTED